MINTNAFFDFIDFQVPNNGGQGSRGYHGWRDVVGLVGDGSLGIGRLGQSEGAARTIAARQPERVREVFVIRYTCWWYS